MPRPNQRTGAAARKEERKRKRAREEEAADAKLEAEKRARYTKSQLPQDLPVVGLDHVDGTADGEPAWPELDPDKKAYFRQIAERIDELEELGIGQQQADEEEDDVEFTDERHLILRGALDSLNGHELAAAGDIDTSVILERLLYSTDAFVKRVLADRFAGSYESVSKHRSASHVLQTLLSLSAPTLEREASGIVSSAPSGSDAPELPTLTASMCSLANELAANAPGLLFDPFASHIIRVLLLVLSGVPVANERAGINRSRKSAKYRKRQGKMKSFIPANDDEADKETKDRFRVPTEFAEARRRLHSALAGIDEKGDGSGVRAAAMEAVAAPVIRVLVELELQADSDLEPIFCDALLYGAASNTTSLSKEQDARSEYLGGLIRHAAGSTVSEAIVAGCSAPLFSHVWGTVFVNRLQRLAANAVANFVLAQAIARLDAEAMKAAVREFESIPNERRGEWIDNSRTGVLKALVDRAAELRVCEQKVVELILDTFGLKTDDERKLLVPCVMTLSRLQWYKKLGAENQPDPSTQGSLLLQAMTKMAAPAQADIVASLVSLPMDRLLAYAYSSIASRLFDAILSSPTTTPKELRTLLMHFTAQYDKLADDRIGSRVAERMFERADVYLKDKIASSLADKQLVLQSSQYAHFFARKLELPLWERRREEWKNKMRTRGGSATVTNGKKEDKKADESTTKQQKKKEKKEDDEIDAIFG